MSESTLLDIIRARDYSLLIENASKNIDDAALDYLFIGIDESSNRNEIYELVNKLIEKGMARGSAPLWWEKRLCADGTILYVYGGINSKNKQHLAISIEDFGSPVKYENYEDLQVVDHMLSHFFSYGKILILTENSRKNDIEGLKKLLNEKIKPILNQQHNNKFSLVCFFKKGKTNINDYCTKVFDYIEQGEFDFGYSQFFI